MSKQKYILLEDAINGIKINDEIFQNEDFGYIIIHRDSFINELICWICEALRADKPDAILMKTDLKELFNTKDNYLFSSISTNEYIGKDDSEFDELCKELLTLNTDYNG